MCEKESPGDRSRNQMNSAWLWALTAFIPAPAATAWAEDCQFREKLNVCVYEWVSIYWAAISVHSISETTVPPAGRNPFSQCRFLLILV